MRLHQQEKRVHRHFFCSDMRLHQQTLHQRVFTPPIFYTKKQIPDMILDVFASAFTPGLTQLVFLEIKTV